MTVGSLMLVAGDELVHHKVVEMGDQRTAERFDLVRQIDTLKEITEVDVSAAIQALEDKLREITESIVPGTASWEPTDQRVADYWMTLTRPGQNEFLRAANVRVEVKPGYFRFRITESGIIQVMHLEAAEVRSDQS